MASECYVWIDIFTINQHDPGADLHEGRTLAATIAQCATVAVVLDSKTMPLSRLWCLYEIGSTPPEKLVLLTHGFDASVLSAAFERIDVKSADCYSQADKQMIRGLVRSRHKSLSAFTRLLKLLLVLKPTSYLDDVKALLARPTGTFNFQLLHAFLATVTPPSSRLACIVGGPGEGKSTLAAALFRPREISGSGSVTKELHCFRGSYCSIRGGGSALVQVAHFCKSADVRRQDIGVVIRSLAYQLALHHVPFAERLLRLTRSEVESLQAPTDAFRLLLQEPLIGLPGLRTVVLIDALDESSVPDKPVSPILRLLLDLGGLPGSAISFIVTVRPDEAFLGPLRRRWGTGFQTFCPDDLRHLEGSGGVPLLRALRIALEPLAAPPTLDAAYSAFFSSSTLLHHAAALAMLAASRQPQSLADLEAMGMRSAVLALPGWGVLFVEREHRVHLLHRSITEWLFSSGGVSVANGHSSLADFIWRQKLQPWLFPARGDVAAPEPPAGSYAISHAVAHLSAAGRQADASSLMLRLPWLQTTLRERGLKVLLDDVAGLAQPGDGTLSVLLSVLRLSAPVLLGMDAAACLPAQLAGRLRGASLAAELSSLVAEAQAWRGELPWLRLLTGSLRAPGVLENTLVCPCSVTCLAQLADGQIVCGAEDGAVRIWNSDTGECEATLTGHTAPVYGAAGLHRRRIVSASYDFLLRIWNVDTGECEQVLRGHEDRLNAVTALPDGKVASASCDNTIRLWDVSTGLADTLSGHTDSVWALAQLSGRLASSAEDNTVRIWDLSSLECLAILSGHTDGICGLAALADGRLASGSRDKTLRLWAADTFVCEATLTGHTGEIYAVAGLPDGRIASGSLDRTVRIWTHAGACASVLEGHTDTVLAVAALPGGRVMSASEDCSLRLWNPAQAGATDEDIPGHSGRVNALIALPDGRVASGADDGAIRLWDTNTGRCIATMASHSSPVNALALLRSGRLASGAGRTWSIYTRRMVRAFLARLLAWLGLLAWLMLIHAHHSTTQLIIQQTTACVYGILTLSAARRSCTAVRVP